MINKEKLLLLATIYMLLPGAAPAMAENAETEKTKNKRSSSVQKVQAVKADAGKKQTSRKK